MIEELGIRIISKSQRKRIKGYTKYDDVLTYHHIVEKQFGGKTTLENGALVRGYNHRWLHTLPPSQKEKINQAIQEYKTAILSGIASLDESGNITASFDFSEVERFIDSLPSFSTEEPKIKKKKFNRAKEKRKLQREIDEVLYGEEDIEDEVEDMSIDYDPKELMKWKLRNAAKGQAQSLLREKTMSDEQRKREFEVIEAFVHYIDDYDDNQRKLADYDRMKAEYENWQKVLIDDGR